MPVPSAVLLYIGAGQHGITIRSTFAPWTDPLQQEKRVFSDLPAIAARRFVNRSVSPPALWPAAALGIMTGGGIMAGAVDAVHACVPLVVYYLVLRTYTSSSAWRDNISGLDWLPSSVQVKYRQLLLCIEFYHLLYMQYIHAVQRHQSKTSMRLKMSSSPSRELSVSSCGGGCGCCCCCCCCCTAFEAPTDGAADSVRLISALRHARPFLMSCFWTTSTCAPAKNASLFSTFPMFVPSLSW
jgi:hypothetical protein